MTRKNLKNENSKISKVLQCFCCSPDRDVRIIKKYQFQNVNGTRIWGTLWNCIESSDVELLILARFLRHSWKACLTSRRPHKMGRQLSGGPVGGEVGRVNLPRRSCTKRYRSHITGPERYRMWIHIASREAHPVGFISRSRSRKMMKTYLSALRASRPRAS